MHIYIYVEYLDETDKNTRRYDIQICTYMLLNGWIDGWRINIQIYITCRHIFSIQTNR